MFDSISIIPAFLGLLCTSDALQYGPALGHFHTSSPYGYGEENFALRKPPGLQGALGLQGAPGFQGALGHGYGFGGVAPGGLSHGYGVGYKGEGLGYGPQLGHEFHPGAVGVGFAGYGPGIPHPGFSTAHPSLGGSVIDHTSYGAAKNSLADQQHSSGGGLHQVTSDHGDAAFRSGRVASKDFNGESVAFRDVDEAKNGHHEGKTFLGGRRFDKEGKHAGENVLNENHKKGHNVKSFKKSHHLDESGQTEEFYDEDHDEGGNFAFGGHAGKFGETAAHSFRGGSSDGRFTEGEHQKGGHFGNEHAIEKVDGGEGKIGGSKFARDEHGYGFERGAGEHGLGGHHQASEFFKKSPQFY